MLKHELKMLKHELKNVTSKITRQGGFNKTGEENVTRKGTQGFK